MKITISDKNKKDLFVALFQTLKNCTTLVSLVFDTDKLHIQGMDKSHVCLFDINILKLWFNEYIVDKKVEISFDTHVFYTIINSKQDSNNILIQYDESTDLDNLNVDLVSKENPKGDFNKYFKIPLADYETQLMSIPFVDYDAEFIILSKKICEIVNQMITFGDDIQIKCSEEKINLITNGVTGEMLVNIPIEDLNEYSIVEGESLDLKYSLNYISKMCLTNKLSSDVHFYISSQFPMKIKYDLGDESSFVFYIAPKIGD